MMSYGRARKPFHGKGKKRAVGGLVKKSFIYRLPGSLRMPGYEKKCVDLLTQSNIASTTGVFTTINGISAGNENFNRIGRRVHMKSLRITGQVLKNAAVVGVDDYVRVIVFYDREGTTSTISDLLTSTDATGATSSAVYDMINSANFVRYVVLADVRFSLPTILDTGGAQSRQSSDYTDYKGEVNFDRFIKLRDLTTEYGSGGSIQAGGLQMLVLGNNIAVAAPSKFVWTARLRYSDV